MPSSSQSTWTPFDCLPLADQTPSGLLERFTSEVEVAIRPGISLRGAMGDDQAMAAPIGEDGQVDTHKYNTSKYVNQQDDLTLQITTHRIVLWEEEASASANDNSNAAYRSKQKAVTGLSATSTANKPRRRRQARFLHLSHLLQCSAESGGYFASPKILLNTYSGDFLLAFSRAPQRDEILQILLKTLSRQEWEKTTEQSKTAQKTKALTQHKVGVDAILAKNKIRHLQNTKLTDQALASTDAETLLKEATELVKIIQKYVATLEKQQEDTNTNEDAKQLVSLMMDMGMTSAFSKADFGKGNSLNMYYTQLARQLGDFLLPKLSKVGGVMTLTDAYCMFNRARASNLISPEDLVKAVELMPDLHLGMAPRTFPSGLIVLQEDAVSDVQIATILKDHSANGLNELEAARVLQTSALLAHEQLLAAEQMGTLVRDESLEMLRFFPNRFDEWVQAIQNRKQ